MCLIQRSDTSICTCAASPLFFKRILHRRLLKPAAVCSTLLLPRFSDALAPQGVWAHARVRVHWQECLLMFTAAAKCVFLRANLYLDMLFLSPLPSASCSRKRRLMSVSLSADFIKCQGKHIACLQVAAVCSNEPRWLTTEDGRKFTHSCKHDDRLAVFFSCLLSRKRKKKETSNAFFLFLV